MYHPWFSTRAVEKPEGKDFRLESLSRTLWTKELGFEVTHQTELFAQFPIPALGVKEYATIKSNVVKVERAHWGL